MVVYISIPNSFPGCRFRTMTEFDNHALRRDYLEQPSFVQSWFFRLAKARLDACPDDFSARSHAEDLASSMAWPDEAPSSSHIPIKFIFTNDRHPTVDDDFDNEGYPTFTLWASLDIVIVRGVKHFYNKSDGKEYPAVFGKAPLPEEFSHDDRFHGSCLFAFDDANDRAANMIVEALLTTVLVYDLEERVDLIRYFRCEDSMKAALGYRERLPWYPTKFMKWTAGVVSKMTALEVIQEINPGYLTYTTQFVLEEAVPSCERLAAEVWRFPPQDHQARHHFHNEVLKQVMQNKQEDRASPQPSPSADTMNRHSPLPAATAAPRPSPSVDPHHTTEDRLGPGTAEPIPPAIDGTTVVPILAAIDETTVVPAPAQPSPPVDSLNPSTTDQYYELSEFSGCTFRTGNMNKLKTTYLQTPFSLHSMFFRLAEALQKAGRTRVEGVEEQGVSENARERIEFTFTDSDLRPNSFSDSFERKVANITLWASDGVVVVCGVKHFFKGGKKFPAIFARESHPKLADVSYNLPNCVFSFKDDPNFESLFAEVLLTTAAVFDLKEPVNLTGYFKDLIAKEAAEKLTWRPSTPFLTAGDLQAKSAREVVEEANPGKQVYSTEFVRTETLPSFERLAVQNWCFPPVDNVARHDLHNEVMKQVLQSKFIGKDVEPCEKLQFAHEIGDYRTLVSLASKPDVHCSCETLYCCFVRNDIRCYGDLYDFLLHSLSTDKPIASFQVAPKNLVLQALQHATPAKMLSSVNKRDGSSTWYDWNRAPVPFLRNFAYTSLLVMLIILHTTVFARAFPSVVPGYAEESITDCLAKNSTYNYLDDYNALFRHLKKGAFTVCPEWPGFILTGATLLHRSAINASETDVEFYNRKDLPPDVVSNDSYVHALQFKWKSNFRDVKGNRETYYGATHVVLSWTPEPYHSDVANISRRRQVMDMQFVHRIVPKSSIALRKYGWISFQVVLCLFAVFGSILILVSRAGDKKGLIPHNPAALIELVVWGVLEVTAVVSTLVTIGLLWSIKGDGDWSGYERWVQLVQFSRVATLVSAVPGMRFLTVSPTIPTLLATLKVCAALLLVSSLIVVMIAKPYESTGWFEGITLTFLTRFFLSFSMLVVGSAVASFRSQTYTDEDVNYQYNLMLKAKDLLTNKRRDAIRNLDDLNSKVEYRDLRWQLSMSSAHHYLPILSIILLVGASIISVVVPPSDLKAPLGAREGTTQSHFSLQGGLF